MRDGVVQATVSSVAVKTAPTKVTYTEGENLDLAGLVVTLTKSDNSTEEVAFANFGTKGITTNKANGTALATTDTQVVISVNGKTVNQAITVNAAAVTVSGVAVKTAPTKVTYTEGENLDLTGLVVTLTKSDNSTEEVAFANFGTKGITTNKANGTALATTDTQVVISVNGKTVNQAITVNAAASISNLSTSQLTEAATNDGTLTNGVIDVTIQNGTFAADIAKANVVAANLPAGMDYTVVRTDDTHLRITVTGTAAAHANANDVNNITFTIAQAKVTGANAGLTTGAISINFND